MAIPLHAGVTSTLNSQISLVCTTVTQYRNQVFIIYRLGSTEAWVAMRWALLVTAFNHGLQHGAVPCKPQRTSQPLERVTWAPRTPGSRRMRFYRARGRDV